MGRVIVLTNEELGAVMARLDQVASRDVVLVVPRSCRALESALALGLLRRRTQREALRLTLVAQSPRLRDQARTCGLRAASGLFGAGLSGEERGAVLAAVDAEGLPTGWLRWGALPGLVGRVAMVGSLAGVVMGGLGAVLPGANVTVFPQRETVESVPTLMARLQPDGETPALPARLLQTEVTGSIEREAPPSTPTGGRSGGQVTFINRGSANVSVPRGTRVATSSGIQFNTLEEVRVPAGQARAPVLALSPGVGGNVGPQAISVIVDSPLAQDLAVVNETAMAGGSEAPTPAAEAGGDLGRDMQRQLREDLAGRAMSQLEGMRRAGESFYRESVAYDFVPEAVQRDTSTPTRLVVQGWLQASAVAFSGEAVQHAVTEILMEQASGPRELEIGSLDVSPLEAVEWDSEMVTFRVRGRARLVAPVRLEAVRDAVRGRSVSEAETRLAQFPYMARPALLEVSPPWLGSVSAQDWRISVRVNPE